MAAELRSERGGLGSVSGSAPFRARHKTRTWQIIDGHDSREESGCLSHPVGAADHHGDTTSDLAVGGKLCVVRELRVFWR